MTLEDEITRYYDAISLDYDKSAGYTNPEVEELRKSIKERLWYRILDSGNSGDLKISVSHRYQSFHDINGC